MFLNRLLYLICLLAAGLFFAAYDGWISMYFLVMVLGIPVLSLLYLGISASLMRMRIHSEAADAGSARILVHIERPVLLSRLMIKTETGDLMLGRKKTESFEITDKDTYCPLGLNHCGTYEIRILKASVHDPFGLFSMRIRGDRNSILTVYPGKDDAEDLPSLQELLPHSFRPKNDFSYSEIYEYRDYRPSDPIRNINWKLSGKRDSLIIREPQEISEKELRILLVLTEDGADNDRALAKLNGIHERMSEASRKYVLVSKNQKLLFRIASDDDFNKAVEDLLQTKIIENEPDEQDDYFCVITGGAVS